MKNRIVLSYGEDEYLPILISIGHNLKEKNIFFLDCKNTIRNGEFIVVLGDLYKDGIDKKQVNIVITYHEGNFIRGFLYLHGKEYSIEDYKTYANLQIGEYCYDNLAAARLPDSFSYDI